MNLLLRALFFAGLAWLVGPGEGDGRAELFQLFQHLLALVPPVAGLLALWVVGLVCLFIGAYFVGVSAIVGLIGALVLPWAAEFTPVWKAVSPFPSWMIVPIFILGTVLVAHVRALAPTFRSRNLRVTDGGDHIAVERDDGLTVLKRGFVICERSADRQIGFHASGGPRLALNTGTVTTYGPGGVGYGTVMTTQVVNEPVHVEQRWEYTGKLHYWLEEVGQDHSLLTARRPADVQVVGRHAESHRAQRAGFLLSGWARFRFDAWRRVHSRLFHRPERGMARRIARAAAKHRDGMKGKFSQFGRIRTCHLVLDHDLDLVSFVGLTRDTCLVHVAEPPQSSQIKSADMDEFAQGSSGVRVPGSQRSIPTGKAGRTLEKWAKLAEMRKKKGKA